jgi:hypothetical protein
MRRVFEVAYGADGMPSTLYSKWFARLLNSVGLQDPALVFHSLRHSAKDALRGSLAPSYVIDRIIGHAEQESAAYGEGAALDICYDAVRAMKLPANPLDFVKKPN